jgi:hypothetical protein
MTIVLRREQHEVLARIPEESFVEEALARLRAQPPGSEVPPAGPLLDAWLRGCIARAHAHGITHQHHVWQFVKLAGTLGADFTTQPWAREILALDLGGGTKINALWHELRQRQAPTEGSG